MKDEHFSFRHLESLDSWPLVLIQAVYLDSSNYPGGNYPGGNYPGGNCPGGNCPGDNYPGGNFLFTPFIIRSIKSLYYNSLFFCFAFILRQRLNTLSISIVYITMILPNPSRTFV